jgi:DNA sulfur modification protein DndE
MKPPCETLRLGKQSRDNLIKIKRVTGIEHWNIICRWALFVSLREPTRPVVPPETSEGGVEIAWKVFAGELNDVIAAVLYIRMSYEVEGRDNECAGVLRAHVTRGLGYLASGTETKSMSSFITRWCTVVDRNSSHLINA